MEIVAIFVILTYEWSKFKPKIKLKIFQRGGGEWTFSKFYGGLYASLKRLKYDLVIYIEFSKCLMILLIDFSLFHKLRRNISIVLSRSILITGALQ